MKFPKLRTERLTLRQPQISDKDRLTTYMQEGTVQTYIPNIPRGEDYTEANAIEHLHRVQDAYDPTKKIVWAIEHHADKSFIGLINIHNINTHNRKGELAYNLDPNYHEQGLMTEGIESAITYAFNDLHFNKVEAETAVENKPSINLLKKLGFKEEGRKRQSIFVQNTFYDTYIYGLLAEEWNT